MIRCKRCIKGQALTDEDGRVTCLACGWSLDPEPTLLEKMASNATAENPGEGEDRIAYGPRLSIVAPAEVTARVLATIRAEAARAV